MELITFHNPQSLKPEDYDYLSGWRLLTLEESAQLCLVVLSHEAFVQLAKFLGLEFYSEASCSWYKIPLTETKYLSYKFSYRTRIPLGYKNLPEENNSSALNEAELDFIESHNFLADYHHQIMVEKGFWVNRLNIVEACRIYGLNNHCDHLAEAALAAVNCQGLVLVATEISEMVEGIRHGNGPDDKIPEFTAAEAESADVYLRLMDLAHGNGWRVAEAVVAKIHMNKTREAMHGGKKF